jgi:hypothetical protein
VRDSLGVYVDLSAGVNVNSHQAFWTFTSVDPATGQAPLNPMDGFLPVNDSLSHHGEGFVSYTIRPRDDAQSGDTIHAVARIVFDVNEPIDTPPIFNTIDADPPSSRMQPQAELADSIATIRWTGVDSSGSGVVTYDLHRSLNGEPFALLDSGMTDTSYSFTAEIYNVYRYFVIAHDGVGYVEPMKTTAEVSVDIEPEAELGSVDSLTIQIASNESNQRNAILKWTPLVDSTGQRMVNTIYWVYSRPNMANDLDVYRYTGSTTDTSYTYPNVATDGARKRFFFIVAHQDAGFLSHPIAPPPGMIATGRRAVPVYTNLPVFDDADIPAGSMFSPGSVSERKSDANPAQNGKRDQAGDAKTRK